MVSGVSLLRQKSGYYFIIRHNIRTYQSDGVVQVVRGRSGADKAVKDFEACQPSADHQAGWRYFHEKADLSSSMEPAEATELRQAQLERRESKDS